MKTDPINKNSKKFFSLTNTVLTLSIITTNKKRIAIAPTYIIIKTRAKKSTVNKKSIQDAQQNVKIKNRIECMGLEAKKTNKPQKQNIINNIKCKIIIRK